MKINKPNNTRILNSNKRKNKCKLKNKGKIILQKNFHSRKNLTNKDKRKNINIKPVIFCKINLKKS